MHNLVIIIYNNSHQLQVTKDEVEKHKQGIAVHEEARAQLEKQNSKLKKVCKEISQVMYTRSCGVCL